MLVITRKVNQTFKIGPDITVMVVDVQNGTVRLGITAPKSVQIKRDDMINDLPR